MVQISDYIKNRKTYIFAEINRLRNSLKKEGKHVLDFGTGDCSLGAPHKVVEALREAALDIDHHHYSYYNGIPEFREEVKNWLIRRFDQHLDPVKEITAVIGSKEAVFRFPQAVLNRGDIALVPDPGYPPYASGAEHAGGKIHYMPLKEENLFLPDLCAIPENIKKKTKLIYLNYPHNPTSATLTEEFCEQLMSEADLYDWAVFSDMAYSEIYEGEQPLSMLKFDPERKRVIELFSFSKSYNMTGFRLGFAAGNQELVQALVAVKTSQGSAPFEVVQIAGIEALKLPDTETDKNREFYTNNRKLMKKILREAGMEFFDSKASFYVWAKVPQGYTSFEWCKILLEKYHIVTVPGAGLGPSGEGYFRVSLTRSLSDMEEFKKRIMSIT